MVSPADGEKSHDPRYSLDAIHRLAGFGQIEYRGKKVPRDVAALGLGLEDVRECLQALRAADFAHSIWYAQLRAGTTSTTPATGLLAAACWTSTSSFGSTTVALSSSCVHSTTEGSMNNRPEICPDCETGHLHPEIYSDEIEYRDHMLRVEGLLCLLCDSCGAEVFRPEQIRANDRLIAEAKRRADGLLLADEIRGIRASLGLTQHEAAAIFGGGANAFSKYERGEVSQSVAMDRLLRLVARYPILLTDLAMAAGMQPRTTPVTGASTIQQGMGAEDSARISVAMEGEPTR